MRQISARGRAVVGGDHRVRDGGSFVGIADSELPAPERGIEPRKSNVAADASLLARIGGLVGDVTITVRVAEVLPLGSAAQAHRRMERGGVRGKLLLKP